MVIVEPALFRTDWPGVCCLVEAREFQDSNEPGSGVHSRSGEGTDPQECARARDLIGCALSPMFAHDGQKC